MFTATLMAIEALTRSGDVNGTWVNEYLNVGSVAGLLILLIAGCIVGPVAEEFVCRGFMFQGWSQSILGPVGSIALSSALWAVAHIQYHWIDQFWIFLSGLALGYFRWRSNSTWLAVMIHSAMNIYAFFSMGRYI